MVHFEAAAPRYWWLRRGSAGSWCLLALHTAVTRTSCCCDFVFQTNVVVHSTNKAVTTCCACAGNKVYQHAMQQCTQERAAAESQGTRGPSTVGVNASSDVRIAGNCVAKIIKKQGWAELDCSGGDLATARGIEVSCAACNNNL